jgi:flagellar biosynthetic protein FliO
MSTPIWPSLAALFIVLVAIPLSLWLFKFFGRLHPSQAGPLRIVHRTALGPREHMAIVKAGERTLLIGITAQSINTLCELNDVDLETQQSSERLAHVRSNTTTSPLHPFAALLQRLRKP